MVDPLLGDPDPLPAEGWRRPAGKAVRTRVPDWLQAHLRPAARVRQPVTAWRQQRRQGCAVPFSLGQDLPWFFVFATISVSVVIVATAFRHTKPVTAVALGLVLGGALGNLTDRVVRGPGFSGDVVDFIDLKVWPVFNLADSAIVIGALVLAFGSLAADRSERSAAANGEPAADER